MPWSAQGAQQEAGVDHMGSNLSTFSHFTIKLVFPKEVHKSAAMEGFGEGIETTIPSTSTMGDGSVVVTADGGSETSETPETPLRMKWCRNILLAFIATGLFAAMMTVGVAIGRSFGWNADASQASTVASENVHTGVLDADSSTSIDSDSIAKVAGTAARSKASKAAKSSKTDFSEVGPGDCVDSNVTPYEFVSYAILSCEATAESCFALGLSNFANTPGFVGVEIAEFDADDEDDVRKF